MGETKIRHKITLMDKDVCRNGHDITDKDLMVRVNTNKKTGRVTYYCRACQSYAVAKNNGTTYRGKYAVPQVPTTLEGKLRDKIAKRIEMASEDNLLEVMLLLNKIVSAVEETNE